jgi:di/tricarboxylate transporter
VWVDFRNPLSPTAASAMSSGPRSNNDGSFGLGFLFGLVGTLLMGSVTWIVLKYVYNRPRGGQSLVALSDFGREDLDTDLLDSAEEYRFQE